MLDRQNGTNGNARFYHETTTTANTTTDIDEDDDLILSLSLEDDGDCEEEEEEVIRLVLGQFFNYRSYVMNPDSSKGINSFTS